MYSRIRGSGWEASAPFHTSAHPTPPVAMPSSILPPDSSSTSRAALAISKGLRLSVFAMPAPRPMAPSGDGVYGVHRERVAVELVIPHRIESCFVGQRGEFRVSIQRLIEHR